eukprot:TRINITY_DN11748_c0_g1_i1.p1 TRINITY_DN11748_c0_g1~~TRINITY_DN11748_c0_g1_i1.p1  ORF type:complete len:1220 (+),score=207.67 TRINITY_DN11748_c0_g1_i1:36-3662(+)
MNLAQLLVLFVAAIAVNVEERGAGREWVEVETVRDVKGQPHYVFGDSITGVGKSVFVGAASCNAAKGMVRILNSESGDHAEVSRLRSPALQPLDSLGSSITSTSEYEILAGAPGTEQSPGAVYVFRSTSSYSETESGGGQPPPGLIDYNDHHLTDDCIDPNWILHQRITLSRSMKINFGRAIALSRDILAVSSIGKESPYALRDTVSVINRRGTRTFIQTYSGDGEADAVSLYQRTLTRDNVTRFEPVGTLSSRDANVGKDFGHRISFDADARFLGVSAPVRQAALFGHGTDGHLEVTGVTTLDGSAVFNFKTVTIHDGGVLTVTRRDASTKRGGILSIRVQDTLLIMSGGVINISAMGYSGGPASFSSGGASEISRQGESYLGQQETLPTANYGGGGAATSTLIGIHKCIYDGSAPMFPTGYTPTSGEIGEPSGGGGGYGTAGEDGTSVQCGTSGVGGQPYGDADLSSELLFGSGGGSGHPYSFGSGGAGGDGGGIIDIRAKIVINEGMILSNGGRGQNGGYYSGGGGGGSGGSIRIEGEQLTNNGIIQAIGGSGGIRSTSSGSEGTTAVKGGDGGKGRIRLAFVTLHYEGSVDPTPVNSTIYDGSIHVFEQLSNSSQDQPWFIEHTIPRPADAYFTGHSLAVENNFIAYGSDQLLYDPVVSACDVFLYQFSEEAGEFMMFQKIEKPDSQTLTGHTTTHFGHRIKFSRNATAGAEDVALFITSLGNANYPGVLWIYRLNTDFSAFVLSEWLMADTPEPGDSFGSDVFLSTGIDYNHHRLYVLSKNTAGADENIAVGALHVFQYQLNISRSMSSVSCAYSELNLNTSMLCVLVATDLVGKPIGLTKDISQISVLINGVRELVEAFTVSEGVFHFYVTPGTPGSSQLTVAIDDEPLSSDPVQFTVGEELVTDSMSVVCNNTITAGESVVCTITAPGGYKASQGYFSVSIVNTDSHLLYNTWNELISTPLGHYVTRYITSEVPEVFPSSQSNFRAQPTFGEVIVPTEIFWDGIGEYVFHFPTSFEGLYSVFVTYKGEPVLGNNPLFVNVEAPDVSSEQSQFVCDEFTAPNRTTSCVISLRGNIDVRTGWPGIEDFLSVEFQDGGATINFDSHFVWGGVGKIRLWFIPTTESSQIDVFVSFNSTPVPPSTTRTVVVAEQSPTQVCQNAPHALSTIQILRSHAFSYSDDTVFNNAATNVVVNPRTFCENKRP